MILEQEITVLAHHFFGGVYAKPYIIPDGHEVISHKHKYDHMSVLSEGCTIVEADGEQHTYYAPDVIEIKAGVNHSVTAVNGRAVWFCIHATDDLEEDNIENHLIVKIEDAVPSMVKAPFMLDVVSLADELKDHPELWDANEMRTRMFPDSPHREVNDIWLRYNSWDNFDSENPQAFANEHESVWYPAALSLPSFHHVLVELLSNLPDVEVGGILITKIPPGKQVYKHSDAGYWHSECYDTKVLVLIESAPGQSFNYDGESYEGKNGEVFFFNNLVPHWVVNESDTDRISLILAVRKKR